MAAITKYKGQVYEIAEPRLWSLPLIINVASLALMAVAQLIRADRAMSMIAGLAATHNEAVSSVEAATMSLGIVLATIVSLLNWDWDTNKAAVVGLLVGALMEGINSYLSSTIALSSEGAFKWFFSEEFSLGVLSIGSVVVWIVGGKIFAVAYQVWKQEHAGWYPGCSEWYNNLVAADAAEQAREDRLATRRKEKWERQQASGSRQSRATPATVASQTPEIADFRAWAATLAHQPTRDEAVAAMMERGLPDTKSQRDKVGRWHRNHPWPERPAGLLDGDSPF
jgi:hypothetical protein